MSSNSLTACTIKLIVLFSARSFVFFTLVSCIKIDLRKFSGWNPVFQHLLIIHDIIFIPFVSTFRKRFAESLSIPLDFPLVAL